MKEFLKEVGDEGHVELKECETGSPFRLTVSSLSESSTS